ncbi:MAG TPA: D-alanyl-D-alanine carboxypeptidase [Actinomycetes bacterium]|nr:D-alanyl-D-alanine carboxypeptidase [Actinomycetes bacterium]
MRCLRTLAVLVLAAGAAGLATAPAHATGSPVGGPALASRGVVVDYAAGVSRLPKVQAASWVVADATTGEVLAAKAPHVRHRPASTLKTLTAVTLLPRLDKSATYVATDADARVEGSKAGLVPNAPYTVDQLFYGMFLPSGNDAATALAKAAGGVRSTVALMNAEAKTLQALDTTVVNPTGLDADGQYSSAYDLALIFRAGLARPDFRLYIGTLEHPMPGKMPKKGHPRKTYELWNQDRLLQQGYPGLIGGKTGYTTLAGRTFVAAAQRGGHTIIVTLMGIKEPSAAAARSLLAWGFHNASKAHPVGILVPPASTTAHAAPSAAAAASPGAAKATPSVATTHAKTSGTSGHGWLMWAGAALVLVGIALLVRPLVGRRRRGTERDRLLRAARRWSP